MKNAQLLQFWVWCLLKSNHKEWYQDTVGRQIIALQPGQFVFGRKSAAEALKSIENKIRGHVVSLENAGCISVKVTNKFSIISVLNWDVYQAKEDEESPTNHQQIANKSPTDSHKQEQRIKNKEQIKEKYTRFDARLFLSERGVVDQHILDWLEIRKGKKLKATLTAFAKIETEAVISGLGLPGAIKKCCEEGWGGFKASWMGTNPNSPVQTRGTPKMSARQQYMADLATVYEKMEEENGNTTKDDNGILVKDIGPFPRIGP